MIRLKKKAEAERAEEESKMDVDSGTTNGTADGAAAAGGGVKLLGIGGRRAKKTDKAQPKKSPGEIRLQKDIAELDGGTVAQITFPDPNNLLLFQVVVSPDAGYWKGAAYDFSFTIPPDYPHKPPRVKCNTKIYHPNIDLEGNVCLNILREDWKPVLDINTLIFGLIYLFHEPNPEDPLNHAAADLFRSDVEEFRRVVRRTLQGGSVAGEQFRRLI